MSTTRKRKCIFLVVSESCSDFRNVKQKCQILKREASKKVVLLSFGWTFALSVLRLFSSEFLTVYYGSYVFVGDPDAN